MWISKPARSLKNAIEGVSRVCGIIAMIFMVIMMLLTVTDVVLRATFNTPVKGSLELIEYIMVCAGFLGVAWCAVKEGHVKVDLLVSHMPLRAQRIIDLITLLLGMTVVPLAAWQGFVQVRKAFLDKTVSEALDIPSFPFYGIVGFAYGLLGLVLIILIIKLIKKVANNQ